MKDSFGREIDYLRVSVTDRCNLRCVYCMPECGIRHIPQEELLSYEEIIRVIRLCVLSGVTKVRITGGEPLVRKGITEFIKKTAQIDGIKDLSMTTNGVLLSRYARKLKDAGLMRVNVSLDTLSPGRFCRITGSPVMEKVISGIKDAADAGLCPVKVNVLILGRFTLDEAVGFAKMTRNNPVHVRFIEFMPTGYYKGEKIGTDKIIERLPHLYPASVHGNGPAAYFRMKDAAGTVGFISPVSGRFCSLCSRLRLTPRGFIKTCLHSDAGIDIKRYLRGGMRDKDLIGLIRCAISGKPEGYGLGEYRFGGTYEESMCQIGG